MDSGFFIVFIIVLLLVIIILFYKLNNSKYEEYVHKEHRIDLEKVKDLPVWLHGYNRIVIRRTEIITHGKNYNGREVDDNITVIYDSEEGDF